MMTDVRSSVGQNLYLESMVGFHRVKRDVLVLYDLQPDEFPLRTSP